MSFIADTYHSRVVEVPANGGTQTTVPAQGCMNLPVWRWMERAMSSSRIMTTTVWWRCSSTQ